MIKNNSSCGCNAAKPVMPPYSASIIDNCKNKKTQHIAHIEGKGDYKVLALVNTDDGQPFLPVTSTKAVFDECGNSLDSILKNLSDILAEFNKTNTLFLDCNGNVHNLEMVLNCNVKVVDNFNTDSGAKALSARRGKFLYDAIANKYSDVEFADAEDGSVAIKLNESSQASPTEVRRILNGMAELLNLYAEKCDVIFSLLSNLILPSLVPVTSGIYPDHINSTHILRSTLTNSSGNLFCNVGFQWDLDTSNTEVLSQIKDVTANVKWYNSTNTVIEERIISHDYVNKDGKGNHTYITLKVPDEAEYFTITVTVYFNQLPLTSDLITYTLVENYQYLYDFNLVGVDYIVGKEESEVPEVYDSKIENGSMYSYDAFGNLEVLPLDRYDTLYYSKTIMRQMGKLEVDEEVPLYHYDSSLRSLIQVN